MALNFPNSPTDGQIYTDTPSGNRWVWDSANTVWKATSTFTQTITVASSAPGTPVVGQLWWNQDFGRLLVYYNDGTSSQWVDASPSDYTSGLAFGQANTVFGVANSGYGVANAAFGKANNALANTSGTFAGDLSVTGNVGIGTASASYKMDVVGPVLGNTTGNKSYLYRGTVNDGNNDAFEVLYNRSSSISGWPYADLYLRRSVDNTANQTDVILGADGAGGTFVVRTVSTERLRIDSSGRVTKPYQPAFQASGPGSTQAVTGGNDITFWNTTVYNVGSHFSLSTGRFTAPVAGIYCFVVILFWNNTTGYRRVNIKVNGSSASYYQNITAPADETSACATFITSLSAGDYVAASTQSNGNLWGAHSSFTGYLLG